MVNDQLLGPLMNMAETMGPERATIFCRADLVALYERLIDFIELEDPVWADQPAGRIEVPLSAMWKPLRPGVAWPPGRIDVRGLPF